MRPGGLELPTFWFPPEADSIQRSLEVGRECGEVPCGLGLTLRISRGAWLRRELRTLQSARASMDHDSSSISSDLHYADLVVASHPWCIPCRSGQWFRCGEYRRRTSKKNGAPGGTRTPDLLVRSQTLYPTELRARRVGARP